jgi:hypothetical protein
MEKQQQWDKAYQSLLHAKKEIGDLMDGSSPAMQAFHAQVEEHHTSWAPRVPPPLARNNSNGPCNQGNDKEAADTSKRVWI